MKLPKSYFNNLSSAKYHEYLKLLPNMQQENTRIITMLIFTFAAMTFFGIFAINPTLTTIVDLKKQLADSQYVQEQLRTKINNLSTLQQRYNEITPDVPVIFSAIPDTPSAPLFVGQVETLAKQAHLSVTSLRVSEVQLITQKNTASRNASFSFQLEATGTYEDMLTFAKLLSQMNRIVTVESMGIAKDTKQEKLLVTVRGREYFKK
jgi:Tfp pilus assembly protein PilO